MDNEAALNSLYDSLAGMFARMARDDRNSLSVSSLMFRIGELVQQPINGAGLADTFNGFAGRVSTINPSNGEEVKALLQEIEDFLIGLS